MPVEVHDSIEPLAPAWDALADRVGASPFLRPGWFTAWWRAFGAGAPEIVVVRRDNELAGVLPLYRTGGVLRSMANEHTPEFGFLADDGGTVEQLVAALLGATDRRTSLLFVDPTRPGLDKLRAAVCHGRHRLIVRTLARSPYVRVAEEWESYEQRISSRLRSDLRRRRRLLEKQGRTTIETSDGRTGLDELLREGFAVESASWKGEAGTAIAARPETSRFYRDVANWATERGMLRLTFVRLDDRPIAFGYYLSDGGVRYSLKTAFDPRFREVAPGKLLARAAIKDVFDDGCTRFDFLGDDEPYKIEWATGLRDLVLVQLFAPTTPGRVAWAALGPGRAVTARAGQLARVGWR